MKATNLNEIDRKLHAIVLEANSEIYGTMIGLARSLHDKNIRAFTYTRDSETITAKPQTIQTYINYSKKIGLLDADLNPAIQKDTVRTLDSFQRWLNDIVYDYLEEKNCSLNSIQETALKLLKLSKPEIPTTIKVYNKLQQQMDTSISKYEFNNSLKIMSIFRPDELSLKIRQIIIIPGVVL